MNHPRNTNGLGVSSLPVPGRSLASSDAELVHTARRGDKRAFVEIVARHQAMVCGIAFGILGDFAASEDAAQDAFLTAWRKFNELREPERLRAWLGQIARNAALGHLRRKRGDAPLDTVRDLADESLAPDEVVANEEEAALVREALAKLPETYRLPLVLYYREGQSVRAVAEALGISEDAVKQRLARGREMLRDRMSGLIETVLTRTGPTPIFTMVIAAAIGALTAPAAVAGSVFAAASVATGATSTTAASTAPILTAMSTSKTLIVTTALVAAVCVPIGYHIRPDPRPQATATNVVAAVRIEAPVVPQNSAPTFETSALFAEWRALHATHGTTAEAMPAIYQAIADLSDSFRRRAFRTALIAEWVQVDPAGGLAFFMANGRDATQRRQFFDEWFALDPRAAVDALMAGSPGWEGLARDALVAIARRVPDRVADIVARLPKTEGYWETRVRDAFAIMADGGLAAARSAAEAITGAHREEALAGIAKAWAKSDLDGAIAWAKALPDGVDRNEIIRAALLGKSAVDPVAALDRVGLIPPGGKQGQFASSIGARVLETAARTDFDATVNWIAAHPGRFGNDDLQGISSIVTDRLNADAVGFLTRHAADGSLPALLPAVGHAILNEASGQRTAVWDWLKTQPDDDSSKVLKQRVLSSAGNQDPKLALRLVEDVPTTPEGDKQVQNLAFSLFKSGELFHRYDQLYQQAPERLRQPLVESAFSLLRADNIDDPQRWIARLSQLPEASRARGAESIARAWAVQAPEDATGWAASLTTGEIRTGAMAAITSTWASKDVHSAAALVASMSAGAERDRSAQSLVFAIAEQFPREAWDWALSIGDSSGRNLAASHAAKIMAVRDPATARQWIEAGPFTPEIKATLQSALESPAQSRRPR
ncbi:MAG: sigma-70 family RNA polymerase sigma factor [Verrucomicrobiales bacterium]|nr:sigma-70 family RNA polymerase sigma factor [Verrucomicrobiales bacterium]